MWYLSLAAQLFCKFLVYCINKQLNVFIVYCRYSVDIFQPPVEDGQGESSIPSSPTSPSAFLPGAPPSAGGDECQTPSTPDSDTTPNRTGFVVGTQQDVGDSPPLFYLTPIDKDGRNLRGIQTVPLEDKGEEPLDLEGITFLAVDWKNHRKYKPYALVKSKELECVEDDSMMMHSLDGKYDNWHDG